MSGDRGGCLQTKVTQDPGLPFGYVSNSECDGIFNHLDYCVYKHVLLHKCSRTCVIRSTDGVIVHQLMFTVWISIHLFALAVFHINLQRLERLYVVSSLLIPLAVTIGLLGTGCRGYSIYKSEQIIFIIIFAVLVIVSLLMVVMGTILCHRACRRRNALLSEYDKQHKKALREMLPLLLYPIFFLLLATPLFAFAVDIDSYITTASFLFGIVAPFWSFTTSLLLISHLCVVRCIRKKKVLQNRVHGVRQQYKTEEGSVTINETTRLCQKSDTHFSAPTEN